MNRPIQSLPAVDPIEARQIQQPKHQTQTENNFSQLLQNAIKQVNEAEHASNVKTELLAQGKIENLHDVMITAQKASLTVETAVQIQQKVIDTYNEMMRMQV